jgi:hypothetical protein
MDTLPGGAKDPAPLVGEQLDSLKRNHMDPAALTIGLDETPPAIQANAVRQAERRIAVYLNPVQRRWLRGVEADALQAGFRLSTSAIVRLAIDELRIRGVRGQDLAERLTSFDDQGPEVTQAPSSNAPPGE